MTKDLRPRAVLDEWLDRGLVTLDDEERIVLAEAAFVPSGGGSQQLTISGRNLHDHIAAAVANILEEKPRFLERAACITTGCAPAPRGGWRGGARRSRHGGAAAGQREAHAPARPIRAATRLELRHLHYAE